jgi:HEAT repeat protein
VSFLLPPLPPTFEAALRDVTARKPELRIAAAQRLAEPEPEARERALDGLAALADDPDPRVRASAVRSMTQLAEPTLLPELCDKLEDPDGGVRELAVVALEALDDPAALSALEQALGSTHPEVRFQAVVACVQREPRRDPAQVRALFDDPDPRVRSNAARAYARLQPAPPIEPLLVPLDDEFGEVRYEAALALVRLGSTAGVEIVLDALYDSERALDALDALGGLGGPAELDMLAPIRHLTLSVLRPLVVKVAAARALLRLGDPHGVRALREVLRAWRNDGRSFAVEVVGELGLSELRPELERLLDRPRGVDPQQVRAALDRLRG